MGINAAAALESYGIAERSALANRMRWRDEFWVRGDQKLHVPINADTGTIEITHEALAAILRDAGWKPDADA